MVWFASLLLFLFVAGGLVALALYRKSMRDEDGGADPGHLPPDVLIALGRAHDEARVERRADAEPSE